MRGKTVKHVGRLNSCMLFHAFSSPLFQMCSRQTQLMQTILLLSGCSARDG